MDSELRRIDMLCSHLTSAFNRQESFTDGGSAAILQVEGVAAADMRMERESGGKEGGDGSGEGKRFVRMKARHGGDIVGQILKAHGVKFVFTLSGGHISPVLVGAQAAGIRVVDVRHEVNAVFAADAVSRLSPTVGVACVTAGPGLTNTVTAVRNAMMAHSPLLLLGGATAQLLKGRGSLQDIDQQALFAPHVKWQASISRVADLVPVLTQAFHIAQSGVAGPVFVELPLDVLYPEKVVKDEFVKNTAGSGLVDKVISWAVERKVNSIYSGGLSYSVPTPVPVTPDVAANWQIEKAMKILESAQRPVFVLGSQVVSRVEVVHQVAAAVGALGVPVYLSGMARGLMGRRHPLHLRHKRSLALKQADAIAFFGVPCDFRLGYGRSFPKSTPFISVNLDNTELYLNRTPTLPVQADAADFIIRLANRCSRSRKPGKYRSWLAELRKNDVARDNEIVALSSAPVMARGMACVNPMKLLLAADQVFNEDTVLVADGGDFVATASYIVHPNRLSWLDPGAFGTLGVGAGFAIGAKLCRPEANVWLLWGDGSAGYSLMEFDTMVRHNIPVIAMIGNDACWSQIERDQTPLFGSDVACMLAYNHYEKIAESLGGVGYRIERDEDIAEKLRSAKLQAKEKPVLINAIIGKTDFRKGSISI